LLFLTPWSRGGHASIFEVRGGKSTIKTTPNRCWLHRCFTKSSGRLVKALGERARGPRWDWLDEKTIRVAVIVSAVAGSLFDLIPGKGRFR
jgi:hypothetical protein